MDAKMNSSFGPLRHYSMSITRDHQRLVQFRYPEEGYEKYEFYDLDADREEMEDLYPSKPKLARDMQAELEQKVTEVNRPFQRSGL
jgi:hypothetical protein